MRIITFMLLACALATTAHAQQPAQIRGFSVVLLLGEQQGSVPAEGLSPSALRAIADIKEFLPYKGYRVLDTQWVAGSWHASSKGRIASLDNFILDFQVDTYGRAVRSFASAQARNRCSTIRSRSSRVKRLSSAPHVWWPHVRRPTAR